MATASQLSGTTFERILCDFKDSLTPEEQGDFAGTTLEDVQIRILAIQKSQEKSRTNQNLTRLRGFLEAMNANTSIIEPFLNVNSFVAFVWGPMKFLLQVASTFAESFNALLSAYERIGENLPLFGRYQSLFETDPHMQSVLEMNFRDIFEFHRRAMAVFRRPAWKNIFHATWKRFNTKFEDLLENMRRHKLLLESHASATEFEKAEEARLRAEREFKRMEEQENLRRKDYVAAWLAAADIQSDQERGQLTRIDNPQSGRWLLSKPLVRDWLKPQCDSTPLLWIHGKPGCGKSVLASLVIDKIRETPATKILYFYCRDGDTQRNSFTAMARSFLSQLCYMDDSVVTHLYDIAISRGPSSLNVRKSTEELLTVCLKTVCPVTILLDGVDECKEHEQKAMITWLRKFVEDSVAHAQPSRCLFLSQFDGSTKALLSNIPTILITAQDNRTDIDVYCQTWVRKIALKFGIDETETSKTATEIAERAQGMFLFAKLVIKNLYDQTSLFNFRREMHPEVFPQGLDQAYQRILDRVLDSERPAYQRDAQKLLAWIVCAIRPLWWREVLCAVSIDADSEEVDMANRRWKVDHTELCGPLIEHQPNGTLELVHTSARFYLLQKGIVDEKIEHINFATLCIEYLSLPAFESRLAEERCNENILRGVYAFSDYALICWSKHILAALHDRHEAELTTDLQSAVDSLLEALDPFICLRWSTPAKLPSPSTQVARTIKVMQDRMAKQMVDKSEFEYRLLATMNSVKRLTAEEVAEKTALETLDLYSTLKYIRTQIEKSASDPTCRTMIQDFHGDAIYKCTRLYCDWFHIGFNGPTERSDHISKHDRSYICPHVGCPYAQLGCKTAKELEAHVSKAHSTKLNDDDFPATPKQASNLGSGRHQCQICLRKFTKASNMKSHLRTHSGEKQFICSAPGCQKAFRRQHDCRIHELAHSGEKLFICEGWLHSGAKWGCGKAFHVESALGRHFRSDVGQQCLQPLREQRAALQEQAASVAARQHALIEAGLDASLTELADPDFGFDLAVDHRDSGFQDMEPHSFGAGKVSSSSDPSNDIVMQDTSDTWLG